MLMSFELMEYSKPLGDFEYELVIDNASKEILSQAIIFNDSYSDIYGHTIFKNIDDIKREYEKKE